MLNSAQHIHLVIRRHHYDIEQVVRLLRQAGTRKLKEDERHPFSDQLAVKGRLPSIWEQDFWKVFLFTLEEVRECICYVEENPLKDGHKRQRWSFVVPYDD